MTIRFGDMCKKTTNDFSGDSVLTNPITIALFIVIIMVILATFSFRMCECDGKYKNIISFAIYGIIATAGILFIHNNAVLKIYKNKSSSDDANIIFNSTPDALRRHNIPVSPNVNITDNNPLNLQNSSPLFNKYEGQGEQNSLDKFMNDLE